MDSEYILCKISYCSAEVISRK